MSRARRARASPADRTDWSPTRLPAVRRTVAEAMDASQTRALKRGAPGATTRAVSSFTRMIEALRTAELYWVSADMGHLALDASADLPPWVPGTAIPAPTGLIAWAQAQPEIPGLTIPASPPGP